MKAKEEELRKREQEIKRQEVEYEQRLTNKMTTYVFYSLSFYIVIDSTIPRD